MCRSPGLWQNLENSGSAKHSSSTSLVRAQADERRLSFGGSAWYLLRRLAHRRRRGCDRTYHRRRVSGTHASRRLERSLQLEKAMAYQTWKAECSDNLVENGVDVAGHEEMLMKG